MRIKITNPIHYWHRAYLNRVFEVTDAYDPSHPQYPVMTEQGRTWFDVESATVIEE